MNRRLPVAAGFLALIAAGAALLAMPWARADGAWGGALESLFTSFSAVCVTGLTVVDIGTTYSPAGLALLAVLVEIGCLGLMTCGTFLLVAIGRRLSLSREFSLMNAYGAPGVRGLKGLACWVVGSMLAIEAAGAVALYPHLGHAGKSAFYSIMAFCNAGFGLEPDSLAKFAGDTSFLMLMAAETILGGMGFLVIYNVCTRACVPWRKGPRASLSLHSRTVLRFTLWLLIIGFAAFLATEWDGVLAGRPTGEKLAVGFYQAVTPRTCGFTVAPVSDMNPLTRLFYVFLMAIGGGPGSAAAGMKVTTFAVLLYTIVAMCRGEQETVISRRVVPTEIVRESIVILVALMGLVALATGALLATEAAFVKAGAVGAEALFFEAVSAITTTGLSVEGTTEGLSSAGRCVVMAAMFAGRLGALTVVMMIGDRESRRHVRHPSGELVVG